MWNFKLQPFEDADMHSINVRPSISYCWQPFTLSSPTTPPSPVSNCSCLFTGCQPCTPAVVLCALQYFSRCCTIRWGNNGNSDRLYFSGLQNHCRWWLQPWNLKTPAPWKNGYDQPRQHIKKQRHYFGNKGPSSQSCGFSSSHVWMWELDYKESWAPKNWCFWTVVLEKTLESPLDCKENKPVNPKEISPEY